MELLKDLSFVNYLLISTYTSHTGLTPNLYPLLHYVSVPVY